MAQLPPAGDAAAPANAAVRHDRVFRWPLVTFLLAVATVVAASWYSKQRLPGVAEGVRWLADGDLDREERMRVLGAVVRGARQSSDPADQWAGMMASVALGDRSGYAAAAAQLGSGPVPKVVPKSLERDMLHLGDPMLGNLVRGLLAEAEGDRAAAARAFQQVIAECRLVGNALAQELAVAGLHRVQ